MKKYGDFINETELAFSGIDISNLNPYGKDMD